MRVFMASNCSINFMEALGSPHRRSHPLRLHTMPQPARGPPTGPRTGGPSSIALLYRADTTFVGRLGRTAYPYCSGTPPGLAPIGLRRVYTDIGFCYSPG